MVGGVSRQAAARPDPHRSAAELRCSHCSKRILQAQAQLGITRADQLPTISGGASAVNERNPRTKFFPEYETSANQVDVSLAWELDFWESIAAPPSPRGKPV